MISKYQKDTSFTACLTILEMKLLASQRNSTSTNRLKASVSLRGSARKIVHESSRPNIEDQQIASI